MPLIKSSSDAARQTNIAEMIKAGHPANQAVAAAYHNQREAERHTHDERQAERHEHERRKYGK
jgi:ribosomal protein L12E/L44/L45/RPP1/RPP2